MDEQLGPPDDEIVTGYGVNPSAWQILGAVLFVAFMAQYNYLQLLAAAVKLYVPRN